MLGRKQGKQVRPKGPEATQPESVAPTLIEVTGHSETSKGLGVNYWKGVVGKNIGAQSIHLTALAPLFGSASNFAYVTSSSRLKAHIRLVFLVEVGFSGDLISTGLVFQGAIDCGSKPTESHFGVGEFTTHVRT